MQIILNINSFEVILTIDISSGWGFILDQRVYWDNICLCLEGRVIFIDGIMYLK